MFIAELRGGALMVTRAMVIIVEAVHDDVAVMLLFDLFGEDADEDPGNIDPWMKTMCDHYLHSRDPLCFCFLSLC